MDQSQSTKEPAGGLSGLNTELGGWIDWCGGKCPVEKGVRVDVIFRCGLTATNVPALYDEFDSDNDLVATCWEVIDDSPVGMDIVKWRLTPNAGGNATWALTSS
jgi:hypothetical protein